MASPFRKKSRDAIVFSTWSWEANNVPERVALAWAGTGAKVLYCSMPVSYFRRRSSEAREIRERIFEFRPEYLGEKFSSLQPLGNWQWRNVARAVLVQADALRLEDPLFIYSHVQHIVPLCLAMRQAGLPLVHVCMDYPEPYQHELIELSDRTLVIPKTVFQELRANYGDKIEWIPQSIHLADFEGETAGAAQEPPEWAGIGRPRLGYLGPLHGRLDVPLLREALTQRPRWQFICFGGSEAIPLANVHGRSWGGPKQVASFVSGFDVGAMPYDIADKKNLHCVPLKLLDYFWAGLPVVSTRVLSLADYEDLVYFGDTPAEYIAAVERALAEPASSEKRQRRKQVAREHSTEILGRRLEEILCGAETPTAVVR